MMVKRRSFLTGLLALPAAVVPGKAEAKPKFQFGPWKPIGEVTEWKSGPLWEDDRFVLVRGQIIQKMKFEGPPIKLT